MKHVYTGRDEIEAQFVKDLLAEEGISATIQGAPLQETWGGLNITDNALPSVWVPDEDADRAAPFVEAYRQRQQAEAAAEAANPGDDDPIPARPTWTCAHCGEKVEEQFTQCWHCGHPRPAAAAPTA